MKLKARKALLAAVCGEASEGAGAIKPPSQAMPHDELELSKEKARAALASALLGGGEQEPAPEVELTDTKRKARDALQAALEMQMHHEEAVEAGVQEDEPDLELAKVRAREALEAALAGTAMAGAAGGEDILS